MEKPLQFIENRPPASWIKKPWLTKLPRQVEFFKDILTNVQVVSIEDPNLHRYLNQFEDNDNPMALDAEYTQPRSRNANNPNINNNISVDEGSKIALIQICGPHGALLIQRNLLNPNKEYEKRGIQIMTDFFDTHKFFAKYTVLDFKLMRDFFGQSFSRNIENVELTRIKAYTMSPNFRELIENFAGESTSDFLEKFLSFSDWSQTPLQTRQVLYAAFHVVGLWKAYQEFPEPIYDYISDDMNCPTPIQYINGINRFPVTYDRQYIILFNLQNKTQEELIEILAEKENFLLLHFFNDKAVVEVKKITGFKKFFDTRNIQCGVLDVSTWADEDDIF